VYNYLDSRAYGYKQSEILLRLVGYGMVCLSLYGRVFVVTSWQLCGNSMKLHDNLVEITLVDNLQLNWGSSTLTFQIVNSVRILYRKGLGCSHNWAAAH
jgi:hypothetical protein